MSRMLCLLALRMPLVNVSPLPLDIFNSFSHFTIVYIDDVLVYYKHNGLVVSAKKIKLFQTKIRFLGYDISKRQIRPIDKGI